MWYYICRASCGFTRLALFLFAGGLPRLVLSLVGAQHAAPQLGLAVNFAFSARFRPFSLPWRPTGAARKYSETVSAPVSAL